ncbi:hypothetical protein SO802_020464 [Lithocarpus litseifolius]|uniref:RNase H type-1 domain-containing protein n=1 Tax=Lithocarpus litseifolius TaxID=425828 RepID=A0AAW2CE79_9ROSI
MESHMPGAYTVFRMDYIRVTHCYREANRCADGLARLGTQQDVDVLFYNSPPPSLLDIFLLDLYGHICTGLCPALVGSVSVS